jgi:diketogulonate reductase-like aldo/keto reductase
VPDGRAKHLRAACDASAVALGVEAIDLYQLHVVDPRTSLETSVRALAGLRDAGRIRRVGLSNVNVAQIERAQAIVEVAAVQVELSLLHQDPLLNGVFEHCRAHDILLIAYRPLGGRAGVKRLQRSRALNEISENRGVTPHEVALAWLLALGSNVMPIPGATRAETARSIARAAGMELDGADVARIELEWGVARPRTKQLRNPATVSRLASEAAAPHATAADPAGGDATREGSEPRAAREASVDAEVVLVMGMPGAGKSTVAVELVARGYERLNRDDRGGSLSDLVEELEHGLAAGVRRWVLDNTYASRKSRAEVIERAARYGVPVRCIWLDVGIGEGQVRAIRRLIEVHGRLPSPEEIRARGKTDPRFFGPDAQFRYERTMEAPVEGEGFASIERMRAAPRTPDADRSSTSLGVDGIRRNGDPEGPAAHAGEPARALLLEYDGVLVPLLGDGSPALRADDVTLPIERCEMLRRYAADGWLLFAHAWRPEIGAGHLSPDEVERAFARTRELSGLQISIAFCPHPAGPPVCWCRKPIPGLVLELAMRSGVDLARALYVGRAAADRTMAGRLGVKYREAGQFFATSPA